MSRELWVLGTEVPELLRTPVEPGRLSSEMQSYLKAALRSHLDGAEVVAVVLTSAYRLYYGVQQRHAHPNCYGSPIEVASGIACTSGDHHFLAAGAYSASALYEFNGVDLESLAEHFAPGMRDMALLSMNDWDQEVLPHLSLLPRPVKRERAATQPLPAPAYEKYNLELSPREILAKRLPEDFTNYVEDRLRRIYLRNSTADGRLRPGRKRHASCVFTPDGHLFYGVNLRSRVEQCDRCSEWNAIGASFVGSQSENLVGVIVYSPDYQHGRVECCGKCRNTLGSCINLEFGDLLIRYLDKGHPPRNFLYSEMQNISYGEAEGNSRRRKT